MSKASISNTRLFGKRHQSPGAAMRDAVKRIRHELRRNAKRYGKRSWLDAAAAGL